MIQVRPAAERGHAEFGWLESRHSFSFGEYYDPAHMGFSNLRVINDDRVAGGGGFATHPHRDMEIVSYVLEGALAHQDSLNNGSTIRPGDVQRMSAGTGVRHSEYNASKTEPTRFLQIWLLPARNGLAPGYEQKNFPLEDRRNRLRLVVAAQDRAREGALSIQTDADIYAAVLDKEARVAHALAPGRCAWVQVARGEVSVNGAPLAEGDGAALTDEREITLLGRSDGAEILLFDLPE